MDTCFRIIIRRD